MDTLSHEQAVESHEPAEEAVPADEGRAEAFDDARCDFAVEYADQAQRDHRAFAEAVRQGRIKAVIEA